MHRLELSLLSLLASTAISFGASYTWNNSGGWGDWSDATRWIPNGVPGPNDFATINNGAVVVSTDQAVGQLNFTGGQIRGAATLTVNGLLNWTAGSMGYNVPNPGSLSGTTLIAPGAECRVGNVADEVVLTARTFENAGRLIWTGTLNFNLQYGAVFTNRPQAVFEVQNDTDTYLQDPQGTATRFDNAGLFRKTNSAGITTLAVSFNNYGTNEVWSGTLRSGSGTPLNPLGYTNYGRVTVTAGATQQLANGGWATGIFDVASGGLLQFTRGAYYLNDGVQLIGEGLYQLNGATLSVSGGVIAQNLELALTTSMITGPGDLVVTKTLNWPRGTMTGISGVGRTVIAEGAVCNVGSADGVTLTDRTLENAGRLIWTGTGYFMLNGGVITNRPQGLFEVQADTYLAHGNGNPSHIENAGLFQKTAGAGTTIVSVPAFNNYGTNDVRAGTLQLFGSTPYIQYAGLTRVCGGNIANGSPLQILGGDVWGNGTISGNFDHLVGHDNPGCSPGQLTIAGNYTQGANGTLDIELAGNTPGTSYDRLVIGGTATLGGSLQVTLTDGFYPNTNALFTFLNSASRSGNFSSFSYPSNDVGLRVTNTATSFAVEVINVRPVLAPIPDQTNSEMVQFTYTATATDADRPAQTLTFSLTNSPAGATIDPSTGQITWTPSEAQGPMTTNITVRVTDNGTPNLTVSRTFAIVVNEVNVAPVLTLPADTNINELVHFSATATATDSDIPTNALTFALVSGPEGLTVSTNGLIDWTPTEAQGPSTNTVLISVMDTNSLAVNAKSLSVTNSFQIVVNEVNLPPVLGPLTNQAVSAGETIAFTAVATDADLPLNALAYSLVSPPAGATIAAASGVFTWRVPAVLADTTNLVSVQVTDSGVPPLSDVKPFMVVVKPIAPLTLTLVSLTNGVLTLGVTGPIGPDYVLMASSNLEQWSNLATNLSPATPFQFTDASVGSFSNRAYRVRLQP